MILNAESKTLRNKNLNKFLKQLLVAEALKQKVKPPTFDVTQSSTNFDFQICMKSNHFQQKFNIILRQKL